ncbi:MAG: GAF domain-containing protein, partial [Anaerolineae bacterium]
MDRIETAAAWFRRILAPPLFADQEKARIAGILHAISLAILAVVVIIAIATPFAFERPVQGLSMTGTIALLMLALLFLVWRGRVQLAATIFASGLWLFDTILIYMTGGIDSGVLLGYVVVTVLAGLLLGGRAAILFSVLSAAAGLGMVCAESLGFLPSPLITLTLPAMWLAMAANVVLAAALLYVTMRSLDEALVRARRSARALGRANEGLQREIRERVRAEQQGRQRTAQLEALHQVGLEITAQLDLGALLHSIVSRAVELAGGTIGGFFLYRPEREALEVIVTIGADPTLVGRTVVPGKGLAGNVWQRAKPVIVDDYLHWEGRTSVFDDQYFRGVIGVPVRWGEGALGVLSVASDVPGAFDASDAELLALFATQAAIVLQNARLYDETLRRNRELALLNRVIAASAGSREVEPILEVACRELAQTFGLPQAVAVLVDATGAHLVVVAEYDADGQPSLLGETIAVADAPVLLSLRDKKAPVEVYDAQNDPRLGPIRSLATARDVSSLLLLPLFVEEWVVGGLALGVRELHRFSAQEMALVQRVAEQMSGVLARARLGEEQRHLEAQLRQAQKMEALGRLAGGVAHDFNNLLTVIHLSCRMMERQLHAQDPLLEYVQRIRETGERAIKLTRQLLSFSRREAIRPQPLDLSQVVRDLSQMLQRIIGEDVQLAMVLADDLWLVRADPSQMGQVIVNLAINGRDAMPGGGVLTIETRNV